MRQLTFCEPSTCPKGALASSDELEHRFDVNEQMYNLILKGPPKSFKIPLILDIRVAKSDMCLVHCFLKRVINYLVSMETMLHKPELLR